MGKAFINRTGLRYGRLTVKEFLGKEPPETKTKWLCLCDCGVSIKVTGSNLATGHTQSCGCLLVEKAKARRIYSKDDTPEYTVWRGIKQRTGQAKGKNAAWYNHIEMCPQWKNSFDTFLSDMGKRPSSKHSIERKDNKKGYFPENCVWADAIIQANNRRSNTFINFAGKNQTVAQWARALGIKAHTLYARIFRYGWSLDKALIPNFNK